MASGVKDIQLRELKDTVSQLKTMISEQIELIKKLFSSSNERRSDDIPGRQNLFDEAEVERDPSLLEEETVINN